MTGEFDAEAFDREAANEKLQQVGWQFSNHPRLC
jgi:hypothetical protein